ncbi:MAG: hypothetical protein ACRDCN_10380, partial [Tannerellaceae bacterium]
DIKKIYSHIEQSDQSLMWKYLKIVNSTFGKTNHKTDKPYYFSVDFVYINSPKVNACCAKIIPYLYDKDDNLLVTLCIIDPINFAGSAILRKHELNPKKTLIYNNFTKHFDTEEKPLLSNIECTILHLSGQGVKEKDIAIQLDMPLPRLKRIKTLIFEKLNVSSISEAIYISFKRGYLDTNKEI